MQVTKATPQHSSLNSQTSGSSMKPLAISPSPPEPPRISPTITFISGCASGALARMATNSPRDIASSLQSSKSVSYDPKNLANRCISKKNLTSCTFGTSLQYATLYGLQSLMHDKNDSASMKMAKDAVCAIAGGLVIHPSTVAFYHQDSDPLKSGAQNQLKLLKEKSSTCNSGRKPDENSRGIIPWR